MEFDYSKLLGRITEKVGTQANFARSMGLSEHSVSLKLNGKVAFKQSEILNACKALGIRKEEIHHYFFTEKVQ